MRLTQNTFEVSEDFVRGALELAFEEVYKNRREKYKDSICVIKDAIEFRYECESDFINEFLESGCFSIDPYDEIDSWFGAEEYTYEEIWVKKVYPELNKEDQEELGLYYEEKTEQDRLIYERCDNNDYWYSDEYQLAVANCFNYSN